MTLPAGNKRSNRAVRAGAFTLIELVLVMTILIVGRQGYTGGINGITDLRTLLGWDIRTDGAKYILYFFCCFLLLGTMFLARFVVASKLGRILVAIQERIENVRVQVDPDPRPGLRPDAPARGRAGAGASRRRAPRLGSSAPPASRSAPRARRTGTGSR